MADLEPLDQYAGAKEDLQTGGGPATRNPQRSADSDASSVESVAPESTQIVAFAPLTCCQITDPSVLLASNEPPLASPPAELWLLLAALELMGASQ